MNNDVRSIMVYYAVQLICPVAGLVGGLHVNMYSVAVKCHYLHFTMCFIPNY